jgi:hypothetical protein
MQVTFDTPSIQIHSNGNDVMASAGHLLKEYRLKRGVEWHHMAQYFNQDTLAKIEANILKQTPKMISDYMQAIGYKPIAYHCALTFIGETPVPSPQPLPEPTNRIARKN